MKVVIEYCGRWNYKPKAISLIDKLKPYEYELNEGRTGSFEIKIDDELVFSKLIEKRFPEDKEVERWRWVT